MQSSTRNTPAPWPEVLAHVQQALIEAIRAAEQRQQALTQAMTAAVESPPAWRQALALVQERCAGLEDRRQGAGAKVAEADAGLAEGEAALRRWLQTTEGARAKLADWAAGAIG